jgi:predicted DNA binding CopG/RHH family protein
MKRRAPVFKSEDAERKYWTTHSAAEFIDTLPAVEIEIVTPRRQREQIALPANDLDAIKKLAKRRRMPHRQLMKMWLQERLQLETASAGKQ